MSHIKKNSRAYTLNNAGGAVREQPLHGLEFKKWKKIKNILFFS